MGMRRDALLAAAEMMALAERILLETALEGCMTVNRVIVELGANGVVPGGARFAMDYRHPETAVLQGLWAQADAAFAVCAARRRVGV